jgi:hypothetical protein
VHLVRPSRISRIGCGGHGLLEIFINSRLRTVDLWTSDGRSDVPIYTQFITYIHAASYTNLDLPRAIVCIIMKCAQMLVDGVYGCERHDRLACHVESRGAIEAMFCICG